MSERAAAIGAAAAVLASAGGARAADAPHLDGAALGLWWVIPFAGLLLSIAVVPLLAPNFWHHHFGKISAFWALSFLVPFTGLYGATFALYEILHTLILEYIPFIILLAVLYTVAGGVRITGSLRGTPPVNTGMLLAGSLLASWMGTTGAAMLLIRPLIRANEGRRSQVHVIVFFIFLVANIGGSLTPLGDPPLFLGFLKGVAFFWPTTHLFWPTALAVALLLAIFFLLDSHLYRSDPPSPHAGDPERLGLDGKINLLLLGAVVLAVLISGVWRPAISVTIYHVELELQNLVRDLLLIGIALLSVRFTAARTRHGNAFTWFPILEVAKLFAGIFLTIIPAIAILRAGSGGALAAVLDAVTRPDGQPDNAMYFWTCGILSSFLDNAPTYLVFFNAAGGDATLLMHDLAPTLTAISAGAVFMGANTYIGNAPNFMIRAIAEERGIRMPSFFGYMAWSGLVLLPLFALLTLVFFR